MKNSDAENGTVTVDAISHVLHTDGTTEAVTRENIVLRENEFADLSSALGVGRDGTDALKDDGGFEIKLKEGAAPNFSVGDKFVYNLNVAKDVEGADRNVNISQKLNPNNQDNWEETTEIQKTNPFKPTEPVKTSAKVLFLIDNSTSMKGAFEGVQNIISSFLSKIKTKGADDIQAGIARYTYGINSFSDWQTDDEELKEFLTEKPSGGGVDPYQSIVDAVNSYDMSDVTAKHIYIQ